MEIGISSRLMEFGATDSESYGEVNLDYTNPSGMRKNKRTKIKVVRCSGKRATINGLNSERMKIQCKILRTSLISPK